MKLYEIAAKKPQADHETHADIEIAAHGFSYVNVEIGFNYEGPSSTQHEPDNYTFREHHPATWEAMYVHLAEDTDQMDDDDEKVIKTWPKGSDAEKLPGWDKGCDAQVDDAIEKAAGDLRDDEPDYDEDRGRDSRY